MILAFQIAIPGSVLGALFHSLGANKTLAADGPAVKVSGN